jgi:antitoxin component YwqK of YwqJK toxin-antitoxin module
MKKAVIIILLLVCYYTVVAQETISYRDWLGRLCPKNKASMIYVLNKTDSGWCRKQYHLPDLQLGSIYNFKDSTCTITHGSFQQYYSNGALHTSGSNSNGMPSGIWMSYYRSGAQMYYADYSGTFYRGPLLSWYANGVLSDSIALDPSDSSTVSVGWFINGNISYAGRNIKGRMQGKWKFYHITGHLSAEEWYKDGKLLNKKYYDEDGVPEKDTTSKDRDAFFKKAGNSWADYIERKIYLPTEYKVGKENSLSVKVYCTLNEEGQIDEAYTVLPVLPELDKILLDTLKRSPNWQPAIRQNRRVRYSFYEDLTFKQ